MADGIDWPEGFERTPRRQRTKNRSYEVGIFDAIEDIDRQLDILGVDDWRLETGMDHKKTDPNYPYANPAEPDDPSVVLRWSMGGEQYAVACDAYSRVRDNLRTVGLYVEEKRKMEQRPVETGESEFANARLPPADGETAVEVNGFVAHEVLGIRPDAGAAVVRGAARAMKKKHHPDRGGDRETFQEIVKAEEAMLDE